MHDLLTQSSECVSSNPCGLSIALAVLPPYLHVHIQFRHRPTDHAVLRELTHPMWTGVIFLEYQSNLTSSGLCGAVIACANTELLSDGCSDSSAPWLSRCRENCSVAVCRSLSASSNRRNCSTEIRIIHRVIPARPTKNIRTKQRKRSFISLRDKAETDLRYARFTWAI